MKKLPLTAIILLCSFVRAIPQELPEKDKVDILTTLVNPGKPVVSKTMGAKAPVTPIIRVINNYSAGNLSNIKLVWTLLVNGNTGAKGMIADLSIAPHRSREFYLPAKIPTGPGDEVFLNIRYLLKKPEPSHPAGYVVAKKQLLLKKAIPEELTVKPAGELTLRDEDGNFTVSTPVAGVDFRFNKQTGWLQHCIRNGVALLDDSLGLIINCGPPAGSDTASGLSGQWPAWRRATGNAHLQLFSTSTSSEMVIVKTDYTLPEVGCLLHIRYTINARGEMLVEQVMEADTSGDTATAGAATASSGTGAAGPAARDLRPPRFGMLWTLPAGYDSIAYYGPGPKESDSLETGIYSQLLRTSGTVTAIRWYKAMDRQGAGLQITADSTLLNISVQPANDNPSGARAKLYIDYPQQGEGRTNAWRLLYKVTFVPI